MSAVKTILVAHHRAEVRDRFAAALADARQAFVLADSEQAACTAVADPATPIGLAVVDLRLADDAGGFVHRLRAAAVQPLPVAVFSGTMPSAALVPILAVAGVAGYINEHAATPQILPALAPHLFPDNFDRRTSPRVALGVPVSCRIGTTITIAHALNVSRGGIAIRTMTPVPAQTELHLKFRLPGTQVDIEASGRVAWTDRKVGMGIQLDRVEPREAIDEFVDAYRD